MKSKRLARRSVKQVITWGAPKTFQKILHIWLKLLLWKRGLPAPRYQSSSVFKTVPGVTQPLKPPWPELHQWIRNALCHMKGRAWKTTTIFNTVHEDWPLKARRQQLLPLLKRNFTRTSRDILWNDSSQRPCQFWWIFRRNSTHKRPVWKANTSNLLMAARKMGTWSCHGKNAWAIRHKHPCLQPVTVKHTGACLSSIWCDCLDPMIHERIIPSHGGCWILQNPQTWMLVHRWQQDGTTAMDGCTLLNSQLLLRGVVWEAIDDHWCALACALEQGQVLSRWLCYVCYSMVRLKLLQSDQMKQGTKPTQRPHHRVGHGHVSSQLAGYDRPTDALRQ